MAVMYELGEDASPMRAAIFDVALFRPDLLLPAKNPFPKATRALRSFSRLVPSKVLDPLPWLVLVLFCDYRLSQKVPLLAAAALLQFDTYLRPGETLAHKKGHVLSPVRNASVTYRRWRLAVCPATELGTTKSGSQDDTLFIGDAGRLGAVPVLLWVFSGFTQCLTQSDTPDLLKMPVTNVWTWPSSRNAAVGNHQNLWCDTKKVPSCFVSSPSSLSVF